MLAESAARVAFEHLRVIAHFQQIEEENKRLREALHNPLLIFILDRVNEKTEGGRPAFDVFRSELDTTSDQFSLMSNDEIIEVIPHLTSLGYYVIENDPDDFAESDDCCIMTIVWTIDESTGLPFEWLGENVGGDGWLRRQGSAHRFRHHGPSPVS